MNLQEELREVLLLYREANGKTQENMAEALGISPEYFKDFEAGKGNPTLRILARIRVCFGITIDDLIDKCEEFVIQDLQEANEKKKKKLK